MANVYVSYNGKTFRGARIPEQREEPILSARQILVTPTGTHGILLRNYGQARQREGMDVEEPEVAARAVPTQVTIRENNVLFTVDPWEGQKTGFFLDQRDKREALRKYAAGRRVLNCFSYTGGFSVYAALSSATQVVSVDISAPAIEAARRG